MAKKAKKVIGRYWPIKKKKSGATIIVFRAQIEDGKVDLAPDVDYGTSRAAQLGIRRKVSKLTKCQVFRDQALGGWFLSDGRQLVFERLEKAPSK